MASRTDPCPAAPSMGRAGVQLAVWACVVKNLCLKWKGKGKELVGCLAVLPLTDIQSCVFNLYPALHWIIMLLYRQLQILIWSFVITCSSLNSPRTPSPSITISIYVPHSKLGKTHSMGSIQTLALPQAPRVRQLSPNGNCMCCRHIYKAISLGSF